jgi:hypothetical protein
MEDPCRGSNLGSFKILRTEIRIYCVNMEVMEWTATHRLLTSDATVSRISDYSKVLLAGDRVRSGSTC